MARTGLDRAKDAVYELYNVAEHCGRMATAANRVIADGDVANARECLAAAARSAEMFNYRWQEAIAALDLLGEAEVKRGG